MPPLEREPTTEAEMIARIKAVRARLRGPVPVRPVASASPPPPRRAKLIELITSWRPPAALPAPATPAAAVVLDGDPKPEPAPRPIPPPSHMKVQPVIDIAAAHFGISYNDIISQRRAKLLTHRRHIAMFVAFKATPYSFPHIARVFHRDHSTVIHGVRKIERLVDAHEPETEAAVIEIMARLGLPWPYDKPIVLAPEPPYPPHLPKWGQAWTGEEDAELRRLYWEDRYPLHETARQLGRTISAVAKRLKILRIKKRAYRRAAAP